MATEKRLELPVAVPALVEASAPTRSVRPKNAPRALFESEFIAK